MSTTMSVHQDCRECIKAVGLAWTQVIAAQTLGAPRLLLSTAATAAAKNLGWNMALSTSNGACACSAGSLAPSVACSCCQDNSWTIQWPASTSCLLLSSCQKHLCRTSWAGWPGSLRRCVNLQPYTSRDVHVSTALQLSKRG